LPGSHALSASEFDGRLHTSRIYVLSVREGWYWVCWREVRLVNKSVCAGLCGDDMLKNGVCAAKRASFGNGCRIRLK
jgi:hypothetical protein